MSVEEQVLEKLRSLPLEKKKQVLDFADSLNSKPDAKAQHRSLRGLWKDLDFDITEEDIAKARREM